MKQYNLSIRVLIVEFLAATVLTIASAHAQVTATGDVSPSLPWSSATVGYVGNTSAGTLTVGGGSDLLCNYCYLGNDSGATGVITVGGAGSTLTGSNLYIGNFGSGTATISSGGSASISNYCLVGVDGGGTGVMNVSGTGASLLAYHLSVGATLDGDGAGILHITDGGSVYTSTVGGIQGVWIGYGTASAMVDGKGSSLINRGGGFSVTSSTSATLTICNGGTVSTEGNGAFIGGDPWGNPPTPSGLITVDGAGSALNIVGEQFTVGYIGGGTLTVSRGASVTAANVVIAADSGSNGVVQVDGAGSEWTDTSSVTVGSSGTAVVSITGGGTVAAAGGLAINRLSLLAMDVGRGSSLVIGEGVGTIVNGGRIRFLAGADVPAGNSYTPISAGNWQDSSGTYQAVGGTCNTSTHQFTASAVQAGASGSPISINLLDEQRVLVSDSSTGWSVGASFLAKPTSTPLNFTATTIGSATLGSLGAILPRGQLVLSGWDFSAESGYMPGDPAYLSFDVGAGQSSDDLEAWQYNGNTWTAFPADDLTYDGRYASFTVTGLEGYAVTGIAVVPEPCTLALLAAGAIVWSVMAYEGDGQRELRSHRLSTNKTPQPSFPSPRLRPRRAGGGESRRLTDKKRTRVL